MLNVSTQVSQSIKFSRDQPPERKVKWWTPSNRCYQPQPRWAYFLLASTLANSRVVKQKEWQLNAPKPNSAKKMMTFSRTKTSFDWWTEHRRGQTRPHQVNESSWPMAQRALPCRLTILSQSFSPSKLWKLMMMMLRTSWTMENLARGMTTSKILKMMKAAMIEPWSLAKESTTKLASRRAEVLLVKMHTHFVETTLRKRSRGRMGS